MRVTGLVMSRQPITIPDSTPRVADGDRGAPTIVVGVDGTETSWSAFWWACGEARRLDGRLIAVYVTCPTEKSLSRGAAIAGFDTAAYAAAMDRSNAEQAGALEAEISHRAAELGVEVGFRHVRGDAAAALKKIARGAGADVIAVGRSTKLCHRLAGSLGRRLARDRSAPIVVIVP
jgi:nucleotide-binding universal stress UspA family protein